MKIVTTLEKGDQAGDLLYYNNPSILEGDQAYMCRGYVQEHWGLDSELIEVTLSDTQEPEAQAIGIERNDIDDPTSLWNWIDSHYKYWRCKRPMLVSLSNDLDKLFGSAVKATVYVTVKTVQ